MTSPVEALIDRDSKMLTFAQQVLTTFPKKEMRSDQSLKGCVTDDRFT